jgi:hypothetical protein
MFITLLSLCKNEYEKAISDIVGTWELVELSYTQNGKRINPPLDNPSTLIFEKKDDGIYDSRSGLMKIKNETYLLDYKITGFGSVSITLPLSTIKKIPVTGIGRVQSYHRSFINKNTLEFTTDNEYDYQTEQMYNKVVFRYVRK